MKLTKVAKFFDKVRAVDAYDSTYSFRCQLEPLDMYRTEGTRIKIRNMSADPAVVIPTRGVIKIDAQPYLVSDSSFDYWKTEKIRARFVIQGADDVVEIRSIPQVLAEAAGTLAYASIDFNKYGTDERDSSEYHPQYHIFFSGYESVPENSILSTPGRYYLVRNSYKMVSGLTDALSNVLDDPLVVVDLAGERILDPVTETYTQTAATTRGLFLRWQEHFLYLSQASVKYETGDAQLLLPASQTVRAGGVATFRGETWKVLSAHLQGGYVAAHIRRT